MRMSKRQTMPVYSSHKFSSKLWQPLYCSLTTTRLMIPTRTTGTLYNAACLSAVAVQAYDPESYATKVWPNRLPFQIRSESGLICWDDSDVAVGIAGTNDVLNFVTNFDVRSSHVGKLEVHRGLWEETQLIALLLKNLVAEDKIPDFRDPSLNWWITGHSAGGAKASLLPLAIQDLSPFGIYTFASPRCFKTKSIPFYGYDVHRFENPYDIVPSVPLHRQLKVFKRSSGWSHVGTPIYLTPDGNIDSENGRWLRRLVRHVLRAKSLRPSQIFRAAIQDHSMFRNYHLPLQKWLKVPLTEVPHD